MENRKDGGIGAQTFQVLVDIYQRDKGLFRRALLKEIIPLADDPSQLGDIARKVLDELVKANILDEEGIDRLKKQL